MSLHNHKKILLLTIAILLKLIPCSIGQSDSLVAKKTLLKLDSCIRANYSQHKIQFIDSLLTTALNQAQNSEGVNSPSYANFLYLKGLNLAQRGSYKEAIIDFEMAQAIYQKFPLDTNRIINLARLAQSYSNIGPLTKAQEAVREAEEVIHLQSNFDKGFSQILIWDAKAKINMKLSDLNQAVTLQQRVVDGYVKMGGDNCERYYPDAAANLTSLFLLLQRDQEAIQQVRNLKDFLQNRKISNDLVLWKIYIAEGQISLRQKDYIQAENSFLQALLILTRKNFSNNLATSSTYSLLASFYRTSKNDPDKAEYYYSLIRSNLKEVGITNDYLTARALNDLASLHMQKRLYQQAASELAESQRLIRAEQQTNFNFTAVRQKEIESSSNQAPFQNAMSFAAYLKQKGEKQDTLFRQLSYDAALYSNGLLLDDNRQIRKAIINNKGTQQIYRRWAALKQYVADSIADTPDRISQTKQEIEQLEQQMARISNDYMAGKTRSQIDWRKISEKLQPDEASIAFVRFPAFNLSTKPSDSLLYAALIVRHKQTAPDMIMLCSEQQLIAAMSHKQQPESTYTSRGTELGGRSGTPRTSELYRLIWQPLVSTLKGIKRVYYSPSGLLYNISFAGLRLPVNKKATQSYLMDRFELRQLFSTREVAVGIRPLRGSATMSAMLIGGVNYGSSASNQFDVLPGSEKEVVDIGRLIPKAITLKDTAANEAQIKALSGNSPTIIHLATHGFYFSNYPSTTPASQTAGVQSSSDPLHRSGLAMVGANRGKLTNELMSVANDGILTAYEISILDLSQTRLVVLSACETALGDVQGTEGVYGLQRAFRLAGAEKLVVSLRPVPDRATQQLMTLFYKYLQKGIEVHTAFRLAQSRLRLLNTNPTIWSAFVLVE